MKSASYVRARQAHASGLGIRLPPYADQHSGWEHLGTARGTNAPAAGQPGST